MFFQYKMKCLVVSKKIIHNLCENVIEKSVCVITVCHHSPSLVMPIGDSCTQGKFLLSHIPIPTRGKITAYASRTRICDVIIVL